jgi:transposase
MKTYPVEYRQRVIDLTDDGMSSTEIAEVLGVSGSWVNSIKRLHRAGRPLAPKSRANKRRSLAQREGDILRARIARHHTRRPQTRPEPRRLDHQHLVRAA